MNSKPKVGIVIINYNGEWMLKHCIEELQKLDYPSTEIVLLDNNSTDDSEKTVKENFPKIEIHQTGANLGYSGGAEEAVKMAKQRKWDYLMLMNPDIIFEKDYLSKIIEKCEEDPKIGAIIGKLRQYKFKEQQKTEVIDSAGLLMTSDRRVVDRGQSQKDEGQFDKSEQVFGITGAAPLYRMSALNDIEILNETFDHDFFMYKEDIDISWRLNLFGYKNWYEPTAIAYHGRGTGIEDRETYIKVAQKRKNLSRFQKSHSIRNQHFIQMKNDLWGNIFRDFFPIIWKEILLLGFVTLREPYLYKSLWEVIKKTPRMLKKRRAIMKGKKVSSKEMKRIIALGR